MSDLYFTLGHIALDDGRLLEARELFEKFLAITQEMLEQDPNDCMEQQNLNFAYMNLSQISQQLGDLKKAREYQERAVVTVQAMLDANPGQFIFEHNLVQNYVHLGDVLEASGLREEAQAAFKKALDGIRPGNTLSQIYASDAYKALARLALAQGSLAEASAWYEKADASMRELGEEAIQARYSRTALSAYHTEMATLAFELGRPEEARSHYKKALDITGASVKDDEEALLTEQRAISYKGLADLARVAHKSEEAQSFYGKAPEAFEALEAKTSGKELGLQSQNSLYLQLGDVALLAGNPEKEGPFREKQRPILEALLKEDPQNLPLRRQLGVVYNRLAARAKNQKNQDQVYSFYQKSLEVRTQLAREYPREVRFQIDRVATLRRLAEWEEEQKAPHLQARVEEALAACEAALKEAPLDGELMREQGWFQGKRAEWLWVKGQREEGRRLFDQAIASLQASLRVNPWDKETQLFLQDTYSLLGDSLQFDGRLQEALAVYQQSVPLLEAMAKDEAQATEAVLFRLSNLYSRCGHLAEKSGKLEEASRFYEKDLVAMQALEKKVPTAPSVMGGWWITYSKLGDLARARGRLAEARAYYEKGVAKTEQLMKAHPTELELYRALGRSYSALGDLLLVSGEREEARTAQVQGLGWATWLLRKEPLSATYQYDLAASYRGMGRVAEADGQWEEALDYYERALEIRQVLAKASRSHPERLLELAEAHLDLCALERKRGQARSAYSHHRSADETLASLRQDAAGLEGTLAELERRLAKTRS